MVCQILKMEEGELEVIIDYLFIMVEEVFPLLVMSLMEVGVEESELVRVGVSFTSLEEEEFPN